MPQKSHRWGGNRADVLEQNSMQEITHPRKNTPHPFKNPPKNQVWCNIFQTKENPARSYTLRAFDNPPGMSFKSIQVLQLGAVQINISHDATVNVVLTRSKSLQLGYQQQKGPLREQLRAIKIAHLFPFKGAHQLKLSENRCFFYCF